MVQRERERETDRQTDRQTERCHTGLVNELMTYFVGKTNRATSERRSLSIHKWLAGLRASLFRIDVSLLYDISAAD